MEHYECRKCGQLYRINYHNKPIKVDEDDIERQWKDQKGVDPKTGKAWLTPRMEAVAVSLVKQWEKEKREIK